jgi:hypothetical protein
VNELPEALVRYEDELRDAIRRDRRRGAVRRRVVGGGLAATAAAAIALGVLTALPGGGGASAAARAAEALQGDGGTIMHVDMTGTQQNPDGSVSRWRDERWQQMGPPFAVRQVETTADGRAETAVADGHAQLYDATTNTIYTEAPDPKLHFEKGPRPGTMKVVVPKADGKTYVKVVPATDLKKVTETAAKDEPTQAEDPFRRKILALLQAGKAREDGHVRVDGRDALRLVLGDGSSTYLVDADTYDPIEYTTRGEGGSVTLRFPVYEKLPATDANLALLSLRAQHPDARVDDDPDHYSAASARLFPHG